MDSLQKKFFIKFLWKTSHCRLSHIWETTHRSQPVIDYRAKNPRHHWRANTQDRETHKEDVFVGLHKWRSQPSEVRQALNAKRKVPTIDGCALHCLWKSWYKGRKPKRLIRIPRRYQFCSSLNLLEMHYEELAHRLTSTLNSTMPNVLPSVP